MIKELLDKKELSDYLGFSVGKIDNLIKHNKIEYYKIGKNVRFNVNEVKNWVSNHKQVKV
jgi:excisionase family DNA binding protein|tara:strand:+ start:1024 stop:1203 length:180 start_codon:yes stop_codon:yes gene_type:complete